MKDVTRQQRLDGCRVHQHTRIRLMTRRAWSDHTIAETDGGDPDENDAVTQVRQTRRCPSENVCCRNNRNR